ncbi:MAG TPA: IPT/TIG domain-containing protein [Blastocatellia bacterium]|jgi:hypothetical protein|nr:IPT/TIG domain-containing protein [Blastocatellia bacterium]
MRKIHLSMIASALFATALVGTSAGYGVHSGSSAFLLRTFRTPGSEAPQLTGRQLLFKGKPVDDLVSGKKIKRYEVELTGTGFVSGSTVIINSIRAFPFDPLNRPELRIATIYESATDLRGQFLHGSPPPGLLLIRVVNPDGRESNTLAMDAISASSDLSITSFSPESGPIGTQITLSGVGLASSSVPALTAIRFTAVGSDQFNSALNIVGFYIDSSADDNTLTVVVPRSEVAPICPGGRIGCDPFASPFITPQQYRLQVINSNGMSNSILFQVTPN